MKYVNILSCQVLEVALFRSTLTSVAGCQWTCSSPRVATKLVNKFWWLHAYSKHGAELIWEKLEQSFRIKLRGSKTWWHNCRYLGCVSIGQYLSAVSRRLQWKKTDYGLTDHMLFYGSDTVCQIAATLSGSRTLLSYCVKKLTRYQPYWHPYAVSYGFTCCCTVCETGRSVLT